VWLCSCPPGAACARSSPLAVLHAAVPADSLATYPPAFILQQDIDLPIPKTRRVLGQPMEMCHQLAPFLRAWLPAFGTAVQGQHATCPPLTPTVGLLQIHRGARLCEKSIFPKMRSNKINHLQSSQAPKTGFSHSLALRWAARLTSFFPAPPSASGYPGLQTKFRL
jgi:hypothetical protein